jgi:hypothetical protein
VLSHGEGARFGVERMRSATNHSGWLGHRKSQGPHQGGREFSLPGSCLASSPRAAQILIRDAAPCTCVRLGNPRFPVEATPRRASLPHCSSVLSITLRNWRLMEGSEKLRSADVLQQFERGVERRSVNG